MRRKACSISDKPHRAAVAPLGADQPDEHDQDDRHVPELALLDRRDAAARVADVLGEARDIGRRVEPAARFLGDAPQRRLVHRRIEDTRRRRRPRARRRVCCRSACRRASASTATSYAPASVLTNVPRYWPSRSPVHCSGTSIVDAARPRDVRHHRARRSARRTSDRRPCASIVTASPGSTRSVVVVASTGAGTRSTSHRSICRQKFSCVCPRAGCWRASATPTSPAAGRRSPCRGRTAATPAPASCGRARRCRSAAPWRPA